jgi:TM2 domain-containing membrane protein YozV
MNIMEMIMQSNPRYRMSAGLLGIFGGSMGLHNFYLGNRDKAVTQLLITLIGSLCFGIGPLVTFVWGLVEGIQILSGSINTDAQGNQLIDTVRDNPNSKSKILAGFLACTFGMYGVHNFYLGNTGKAVGQLLLGTIGWCVGVGPIISWIWGLIEGVQIFSGAINRDGQGNPIPDPANDGSHNKSKIGAGLLAMTYGVFGIHNFYLGNTGKAVAQLLLGTVGMCVGVGPIVSWIWGMVEGIKIISGTTTTTDLGESFIYD